MAYKSSIPTPSELALFNASGDAPALVQVGSDGASLSIRLANGDSTSFFNVRWRWRRRLTPAAAYVEDASGADVWHGWSGLDLSSGVENDAETDENGNVWGAWQSVTYASPIGNITPVKKVSSVVSPIRPSVVWHVLTAQNGSELALSVPFALSRYDKAELQLAARQLDSYGDYGDYIVTQYSFVFVPTLTLSGWLNEDGTATLQGITNWTRGDNLLTIAYYSPAVPVDGPPRVGAVSFNVPDDWEVTAPAVAIKPDAIGPRLFPLVALTTADGATVSPRSAANPSYPPTVYLTEPTPITPIPEPTVTIDADGNVTIDGSYDSVAAYATYADEEGNTYQERLNLVEDGGSWSAVLQTPPLDVEFEVAVVVTVGDDWQRYVQTMFVAGDGALHFDWPATDSHFTLRYNLMRQYSVDIQAGSTPIAGRKLPVSRYGGGHTSKMTINGTLVNPAKIPAIGDMWIDALAVLEEPHDWILRAPGGMRRRISIETYVPQFDDATADTLAAVTITANEVDDDGLD